MDSSSKPPERPPEALPGDDQKEENNLPDDKNQTENHVPRRESQSGLDDPSLPGQPSELESESHPEETPLYSVFTPKVKIFVICMTVFATLFSPFSSFIYLPAITPIAEEYHRSVGEINLTVTLYQVMQAISPLFFGDLSDQIGRRPVYILTFAIYAGSNIGLALQNSYGALLVLRALQSTGSSATVAIGNAVMGDLTTSAERGGYMAAVQGSIQVAPALAPVIGGILIQFLGWRSVFWFLLIATGVLLLIYVPFAPEVRLGLLSSQLV